MIVFLPPCTLQFLKLRLCCSWTWKSSKLDSMIASDSSIISFLSQLCKRKERKNKLKIGIRESKYFMRADISDLISVKFFLMQRKKLPWFVRSQNRSFYGTGLPLARTRWVRSTFSSHCPLSSNQRYCLTSVTLILFPLKFFWDCWESNLGLLGEKQVRYHLSMLRWTINDRMSKK